MKCLNCACDFMPLATPLLVFMRGAGVGLRRHVVSRVFQICFARKERHHFICPTCAPLIDAFRVKRNHVYGFDRIQYTPKQLMPIDTCTVCALDVMCQSCATLPTEGSYMCDSCDYITCDKCAAVLWCQSNRCTCRDCATKYLPPKCYGCAYQYSEEEATKEFGWLLPGKYFVGDGGAQCTHCSFKSRPQVFWHGVLKAKRAKN